MIEVGQKLWFVPNERRHSDGYEVEVTKIGRKWAELGHAKLRIDLSDLIADGGRYPSPGSSPESG